MNERTDELKNGVFMADELNKDDAGTAPSQPSERLRARTLEGSPRKPSKTKKAVFFALPVLCAAAIAGGFFVRDSYGDFVWKAWARKWGLLPPHPVARRATAGERKPMDVKYDEALFAKAKIELYVQEQMPALKAEPEKLTLEVVSETLKELERSKIQIVGYRDHLEKMAEVLNDPSGQTLSEVDNVRFNDEFREYQQFLMRLNSAIAEWKDLYRQKGGQVSEAIEAPRAPSFNPRLAFQWGWFPDGLWVRYRVVTRVGTDAYTDYRDVGLKSGARDPERTLVTQSCVDGEAREAAEQTQKWIPEGLKVAGEESLAIGGASVKCVVVEVGPSRVWYAAEGRGAGRLVLKRVEEKKSFVVTALSEEALDFKKQQFNCMRYDAQEKVRDEAGQEEVVAVRAWVHEDVPDGLVKMERRKGETVEVHELIDRGDDWGRRPSFPTKAEAPQEEAPAPPEKPQEPPKSEEQGNGNHEAPQGPWAKEKVGTWYRVKSSMNDMEMYTDTGLKEFKPGETCVLVMQTHMSGQSFPEQEHRLELGTGVAPASPSGEDEVEIEGTKYACEIYETGGTKSWVLKDGRFKGQALKMESPQMTMIVTKLGEEAIQVKDRAFDCIVVDSETDMGGVKTAMRAWVSVDFPLGTVKSETPTSTSMLVDLGDDWSQRTSPFAEEPAAKPAEEPVPNPWANESVGTWFRMKTTASGMVMYTDLGLAELGSDYYVQVGQTYVMGRPGEEQKTRVDLKAAASKKVGEETIAIGEGQYACDIYETEGMKSWVVREGEYKGTALKSESAQVGVIAIALGADVITVKGRRFDCVVVEVEQTTMGQSMKTKTWTSSSLPLRAVRIETPMSKGELVDFGGDWSNRPPLPVAEGEKPKPGSEPAKPEPPVDEKTAKAGAMIAEADEMLRDALPLFQEVITGLRTLSSDKDDLKELVKKAEACQKKLYDAQMRYMLGEAGAADPARINARVKSIDRRLEDLKEFVRAFKAAGRTER
ncbi:MAG: hypothetical protein HYY16_13690 [Planctomycetes bacterium]|nr:hypothetical protein [Planctomycetota bacterium]